MNEKGEPLFNGTDLEGWIGLGTMWTVQDGKLVGRAPAGATSIRRNRHLEGDHTV